MNVTGVSTFSGTINNESSGGQINARNLNAISISTFATVNATNLTVSGFFNVNEITEVVSSLSSAGSAGDVEHDLSVSAI